MIQIEHLRVVTPDQQSLPPDQGSASDLGTAPELRSPWMTYRQASEYTGWSVRYLCNLVSADSIPVYGSPRSRRFRKEWLDQFLTNRDAAMRKFRLESEAHHGS